ncbi:YggS family pyridoxal phosphate-dependent enzyme [Thiomicrorhabdus sediminis]|uniref:Pyridoxal phosphate homeostasis protein n=1 Tax=Thiomicrorhabdus sediminis TaxID=2580412 RepID=A0A4P9K6W8_9GAMM|nr:YggS family pyridoxal phosphate-dependent enzyme [Thiomicrorhabdus sediminis]QCU90844.1 YggS family pyridoxal phosphate-dependent enzyme [Thiomicrorhabdus sediminis]
MDKALQNNYEKVKQRIEEACNKYRSSSDCVQLLAVSKTKPIEMVNTIAELGQKHFGENYVQEALEKIDQRPDLIWHFIGPIQSNKTRPIAENFNWVHSVDRLKIAQRLNDQRPDDKGKLNILLEVNISQQATKSGFSANELSDALKQIATMDNLQVRGLMAIPQPSSDFNQQRQTFAAMQQLLVDLQQEFPELQLDTLSMGMSGDLEAAIAEGATIVRIGTDIFGARDYSK